MLDVKELSNMLNERAESVARHLFPNGKQSGHEWCVGDISGSQGQSLKVCISGSKRGVWKDFATGHGGDLIDLWSAVNGLALSDAIRDVKRYLGVEEQTFTRSKKKEFRRPEIPTSKAVSATKEYLTVERKLSEEALNKYKITEKQDIGPYPNWKKQQPWKGPWIVFHFIRDNELLGVKYLHLHRKEGKKTTLVEPGCEPTCFGWQVIDKNARELVICEGELDAPSLYMYGYPAVSVPFGAGKGDKQQWVDYDWEKLEQFETIYLCMDSDEEGFGAVEELTARLGSHRVMIVTLPRKDANKCLQDGVPKKDIDNAFATAKSYSPAELKTAKAFHKEVLDEFFPAGGKLPGWDIGFPNINFRFLRGEVSLWTGVNGHGKSLILGQLMANAMLQGERVCIASLEMSPKKTLYRMVRQACAASHPRHQDIEDCLTYWDDKLWLFDLVGTGKVDRLLEVFRYAYRRHGVMQFVIDSLLKCGIAEDDYRAQKDLIEKLCDFVNETGTHIHLVAHPRKADDETPAGKMDVKGTGAITDLVFNVFSLWRNKKKEEVLHTYRETGELPRGLTLEDVENTPDNFLFCHKARNLEDAEGKWRLYYHGPSMRFIRSADEPLYVTYESEMGRPPF